MIGSTIAARDGPCCGILSASPTGSSSLPHTDAESLRQQWKQIVAEYGLTDPFLSHHFFWREIGRDDGDVELSNHADPTLPGRLIEQRKWARLIEQLFGRLYILCNQLIHGGATPGCTVIGQEIGSSRVIGSFLVAAVRGSSTAAIPDTTKAAAVSDGSEQASKKLTQLINDDPGLFYSSILCLRPLAFSSGAC